MTEESSTAAAAIVATRAETSYEPLWERFEEAPPSLTLPPPSKSGSNNGTTNNNNNSNNNSNPYNRQYSRLYSVRLNLLRDRCLPTDITSSTSNSSNSSNSKLVSRIIELGEEERSTIVGIAVKEMHDRPPLSSGYHTSHAPSDINPGGAFRHYCHEKDSVVLEDESGRIELEFKDGDAVYGLVTGMVLAVTGRMNGGIMLVDELHPPQFHPFEPENHDMDDDINEDINEDTNGVYVALVSGLYCGRIHEGSSDTLRREMLSDYLTGHMSMSPRGEPSKICRVLVAGGGCMKPVESEDASPYGNWDTLSKDKNKNKNTTIGNSKTGTNEDAMFPLQELDLFLSELCAAGIPVDYIPGLHDPTNANWPQKPIHPCLLPLSERFSTMFHRTTNPYEARIGGKVILGSDGLNIADVRKVMARRIDTRENPPPMKRDEAENDDGSTATKLEPVSTLEALRSTLKAHHVAPTGPDSLPTFPFESTDPFVMERAPGVYFAGNCDGFATDLVLNGDMDEGDGDKGGTRTRLICIPSFAETGQIVLLNLKSLECEVLEFDGLDGDASGAIDEKKMEE